MENLISRAYALGLDEQDCLAKYKAEFYLPDYLYYEANGLGPMSRRSEETLLRVSKEWKDQLVAGWFCGKIPWFYYPECIAAMEEILVGAMEKELIINGTTTTNIHCVLSAFYRPKGRRTKILCDKHIFASDRYAVEAQIALKGYLPVTELILAGGQGLILDEEEIISQMTEEVALVFLPTVVHSTGQLFDIERLTRAAMDRGIPIGFDCSHSVGVVPHRLHECGVDFGVWCNYKYLNGGLGCPATIFIHQKNFDVPVALPGWHGYTKSKQFQKLPHFEAEAGAGGWQHGSPHLLNMAPLEGSLNMVREAGIDALREKSLRLTGYFMELAEARLKEYGVELVTPKEASRRGGHVTILHIASDEITEFLDSGSHNSVKLSNAVKRKMASNERAGHQNQVRISFSPLFTSYLDVWLTAEHLYNLLKV